MPKIIKIEPALKHSQYFLRQDDFLQLQTRSTSEAKTLRGKVPSMIDCVKLGLKGGLLRSLVKIF